MAASHTRIHSRMNRPRTACCSPKDRRSMRCAPSTRLGCRSCCAATRRSSPPALDAAPMSESRYAMARYRMRRSRRWSGWGRCPGAAWRRQISAPTQLLLLIRVHRRLDERAPGEARGTAGLRGRRLARAAGVRSPAVSRRRLLLMTAGSPPPSSAYNWVSSAEARTPAFAREAGRLLLQPSQAPRFTSA